MEKVHVYFHRKLQTKDIFYVGIGVKNRAYRTSRRTKIWHNTVNKYGLEVEIVHSVDTWDEAVALEKMYIKKFGRRDLQTGALVNMTDGGDGSLGNHSGLGRKWSEETRSKLTGRKASEETKRKQSEALKGRKPHPNTIEARKKVGYSGWNKGVPMSEETKKKLSESKKGTVNSPECRAKISEKLKGRIFSDETRRKNSEALKKHIKTEEHRRKLSEATKRYYALKKLVA